MINFKKLMTRRLGNYCLAITLFVFAAIEINLLKAATIAVTSNADTSSPAVCTLRDAITSLNLASLQGGCTNSGGSFGEANLIDFALSFPFIINLDNGPLMVTEDMDIRSNAGGLEEAEQAVVRSALGTLNRVFHVDNARLNIINFTISDGVAENLGQEIGGGIYATNGAELRVSNSVVTNNRSDIGGGIGLDMSSNLTIYNSSVSHNRAIAGAGIGALDGSQVFMLRGTNIEQNHANELGGGIGLRTASLLRIRGSNVVNNRAYANLDDFVGVGLFFPAGTEGGGISASNNSRVEVLEGSTVAGNTALRGGGIHISESNLEVENSIIENNISEGISSVLNETVTLRQGFGGGIYSDTSVLVLQDAEVRANTAGSGGGIYSRGAPLTSGLAAVLQSTIAENVSQNWGGGIYLSSDVNAAIFNSTISGNTAGVDPQVGVFPAGGGIYALGAGNVQVFNSTLALNIAQNGTGGGIYMNTSDVIPWNNIVAGNHASVGSEFTDADGSLSTQTGGNLIGDESKTFSQAADFPFFLLFPNASDVIASSTVRGGADNPESTAINRILLPLANNGGITRTHNLAPNSPALDAGFQFYCSSLNVSLDQRGEPRTDARCDIGSVEVDQTACYAIKAQNGNVITFCL